MSRSKGFSKIIVLLLILAAALLCTRFVLLPRLFPLRYENTVLKYADEFDIEPSLVYGVIFTESRFRPGAVSAKDAKGLMQITDGTGEWAAEQLQIADYSSMSLYHPETNITIGCWYLNKLYKQFDGNWDTVLAAYNAGSGRVTEWLKTPDYSNDGYSLIEIPFDETKNYVKRVRLAQKIYERLYKDILK